MKLSNASLSQVPEGILVPTYDRTSLTPGIVHIGLGNFHRAHQAWYLHRLMQNGVAHDWAIIGAGVRAGDAAMRDRLMSQDCLTTLIQLDPAKTSAEVTGAMIGFVPVAEGNGPLIAQMADPAIRIVALTITESGYYIDAAGGGFDADHADMVYDAANPDRPRTAFGAMIAALKQRRAAGHGPFTAQSCDNLQGNGAILRQTVVSLARMSDPDLAAWIDAHVSFPNSMVDSIVPATGPAEIDMARHFGIDDAAPVTHEAFRQWVIEDDFCAGRPPWEQVGATFTDDVHAYETMKIRILNAGHQVIANAGEILSVQTIAGCMEHPLISSFFEKVATTEIAPQVAPVPGMTPSAYVDLIKARFSNPKIHDTTRRVAFDGSARHTGFVLPLIRQALASDLPITGLALVEASWARMCEGTREDGSLVEPNDPMWDHLQTTARLARTRPMAWLEQHEIYGELDKNSEFSAEFVRWLDLIWQDGVEAALKSYTAKA